MKLAIMQPYFFPYIGYYQLLNSVDTFVIYDDVNFIKKGYINRNAILINNEAKTITLPLNKASQNKRINEITIADGNAKILKSIQTSYKKAPYFDDAFPVIKTILLNDEKNLSTFLGDSLVAISDYLNICTKLIYSRNIEKDNTLKGQAKIIDICQRLNADIYVNASGGQSLYEKNTFQANNISLNFIQTDLVEYKQFKPEFTPFLSIIDIMMFNTKEAISEMLNNFEYI